MKETLKTMAMKRYIFFDFDIMFNLLPALVLYLNEKYKINTITEDFLAQNDTVDVVIKKHRPELAISLNDIYKDLGLNFFYSEKWQQYSEPEIGMRKVIKKLASNFTVVVLANRHNKGENIVKNISDRYIPDCVNYFHFIQSTSTNGELIYSPQKSFIESMAGEKIAFFGFSIEEIREAKTILPASFFYNSDPRVQKSFDVAEVTSWAEIEYIFF